MKLLWKYVLIVVFFAALPLAIFILDLEHIPSKGVFSFVLTPLRFLVGIFYIVPLICSFSLLAFASIFVNVHDVSDFH